MPYSDYVLWLDKQDKEKAKRYWEKYLCGYEGKAVIPFSRKEGNAYYIPEEYSLIFDKETTEKIISFSAKIRPPLILYFKAFGDIITKVQ